MNGVGDMGGAKLRSARKVARILPHELNPDFEEASCGPNSGGVGRGVNPFWSVHGITTKFCPPKSLRDKICQEWHGEACWRRGS